MRGVIVIAAASLGLAGCTSFSSFSLDSLKPAPTPVTVQLDSVPPGADARTSLGPGCKTPCSVPLTADAGSFTVSYTLNKYLPLTVPVQVTRVPGDFTTPASTSVDPNPVVGELQPAKPAKPMARKMVKRRKPAPAAGVAPTAGTTPFPAPADAAPPPSR
jgi:hypothetical protein